MAFGGRPLVTCLQVGGLWWPKSGLWWPPTGNLPANRRPLVAEKWPLVAAPWNRCTSRRPLVAEKRPLVAAPWNRCASRRPLVAAPLISGSFSFLSTEKDVQSGAYFDRRRAPETHCVHRDTKEEESESGHLVDGNLHRGQETIICRTSRNTKDIEECVQSDPQENVVASDKTTRRKEVPTVPKWSQIKYVSLGFLSFCCLLQDKYH